MLHVNVHHVQVYMHIMCVFMCDHCLCVHVCTHHGLVCALSDDTGSFKYTHYVGVCSCTTCASSCTTLVYVQMCLSACNDTTYYNMPCI